MTDPSQVEAPPLYGEDEEEVVAFEGVEGSAYQELQKQRKGKRSEREQYEEAAIAGTGAPAQAPKLSFVQPHKEKRFKLFFQYEGRRGPKQFIKVKLPKSGKFEEGPCLALKKMFVQHYNRLRPMLSEHNVHLRSELGIALADDDALSGYIGYGGMVMVCDGSAPARSYMDESSVHSWGKCAWSDQKEGDMAEPILSLDKKRIKQVVCGPEWAAVLTEGGRVLSWGVNDFGQLGTGDEDNRVLPVHTEVPYEVYINQLAAGAHFCLATTKKGELWSWGRFQASNFPRLFVDSWCNGYESRGEKGIRGEKVAKVQGGEQHMAAITAAGKLYTWGYNDFGQLGWGLHGVDRTGQQKPNMVKGVLEPVEVADVACGASHTICCTKDGRLFGWGSNGAGQLNQGLLQVYNEPTEIPLPDKVVVGTLTASGYCSAFVLENAERPVMQFGKQRHEVAANLNPDAAPVGEGQEQPKPKEEEQQGDVMGHVGGGTQLMGTNAKTVAVGEVHGLYATNAGVVYGWGYNSHMQAIGDSSKSAFVPPQPVDSMPEDWGAVQLACSGGQSYALMKPVRPKA
eukprot:CAMPEP_0204392464 /NCGR_PEP_ID=MMETSP0469-20131031/61771_1 /ASSEMBLY_ACC=CAM_ASM_000384 /TAXON_ID=2969 /ORGANISM="Oxyrrhis marina" /LENGTH=568 /DNA_ID=CAMNT_0051386441 /DNA_START=47 /DNA_END=1753 /DNA_ORIENTATION=+